MAFIAIQYDDGSVRSARIHCEGLPDSAGSALLQYYRDSDKVEKLLNLGDVHSVLGTIAKTRSKTAARLRSRETACRVHASLEDFEAERAPSGDNIVYYLYCHPAGKIWLTRASLAEDSRPRRWNTPRYVLSPDLATRNMKNYKIAPEREGVVL